METAREIAPGIHRIPCLFFGPRVVAVHLLLGKTKSMLVDTGMGTSPGNEILPYMKQIGFDPARLDYIVITHSDIDHQEGNRAMREASPNAIFMCHNLDRAWVESMEALENGRYRQWHAEHGIGQPREGSPDSYAPYVLMDQTFEGGETIRLGPDWVVEIVHTPGHSWGHSGVYDPVSKTFIAGEAALWNAILDKDWQPAYPATYCYADPYIATLGRLRAMDIAMYSGAHWPVMTGPDIGAFLDESKNYFLHTEQSVLEAVKKQPGVTLKDLIGQLKSALGTWPDEADEGLTHPLHANLRRLEDRGLVVRGKNSAGLTCWTAA